MRLRHEQQQRQQRSHRQRLRRQQYQQQRSLLIYARHFEESPPSTPLVSPILHSGWNGVISHVFSVCLRPKCQTLPRQEYMNGCMNSQLPRGLCLKFTGCYGFVPLIVTPIVYNNKLAWQHFLIRC